MLFQSGTDDTTINVGMRVQAGGVKYVAVKATKLATDNPPTINNDTFRLPHESLMRLLEAASTDTLDLGIHPKGDSGWCRLNDTFNGNPCYVIATWKN